MSADITKPETWYGLGLGEIVWFTENSNLQRVPGGWMMYTINTRGRGDVETFIPFSLEFCSIEHLPLVLQTQTSFAGEKNND